MTPKILSGGSFSDERGSLFFNNDFVPSEVKRLYFIENEDTDFVRGWQGHKVEQRWFSAVSGKFKILVAKVEDLEHQNTAEIQVFKLENPSEILHLPKGYASAIQMLEPKSRLLVMADFLLKEIDDDFRFPFTK